MARLIDPQVKVIMSSGYNEQEVTQRFIGKRLAGFIQKPYNLAALKQVIGNTSPSFCNGNATISNHLQTSPLFR